MRIISFAWEYPHNVHALLGHIRLPKRAGRNVIQ